MPLWIFLIFGMEVVLMVFFEKIIFCMPGKFKDVQNLAIFDQIWALLWVFSLYLPKIIADFSSFFNFFEFWLFPGNQSYCVLFLQELNISSFDEFIRIGKFNPFRKKHHDFGKIRKIFTRYKRFESWVVWVVGKKKRLWRCSRKHC